MRGVRQTIADASCRAQSSPSPTIPSCSTSATRPKASLPLSVFQDAGETVKPGDKVSRHRQGPRSRRLLRAHALQGRSSEGLDRAGTCLRREIRIVGTVTAQIKGGFSVDVGVRAFMPASRSGVRDAAEMEKLVGRKFAAASPSSMSPKKIWWSIAAPFWKKKSAPPRSGVTPSLKEGDIVTGTVRNLCRLRRLH